MSENYLNYLYADQTINSKLKAGLSYAWNFQKGAK